MLTWLGNFDPAPLFVLSLFPYISFLWWAQRSNRFPPLALFGFFSTLLFVCISIAGSLLAKSHYGANLVDIDLLHGGAEFFLTLSNLLIVIGFKEYSEPKKIIDVE